MNLREISSTDVDAIHNATREVEADLAWLQVVRALGVNGEAGIADAVADLEAHARALVELLA